MNIPATNIRIDNEKVCKHMPIAVSIACVVILLTFEIFNLSGFYTAILMLIIGFSASVILYVMLDKKRKDVVKLDDLEDAVFDEIDPVESMLNDLENIVISVNNISAKQIEASRIQTEDAISAILNRFIQLNEDFSQFTTSHKMENDDAVLKFKSSLSDMLISFQFQDRTSQILQHVSNSLEIFNNEINNVRALRDQDGQPQYQPDELMKKVTAGFTTAEQHAMISNKGDIPPSSSIELF